MSFLHAVEFKVGALVLGVAGLIAFMSMKVSDDPALLSRTQRAWFLLPSASGLIKNSAVKSAGISVGSIKDIRLQDGLARIDIGVRSEVQLTTSAAVMVKANGILGDKYVEVYPGSQTDPPLESGAQILTVKDGGSLDGLISEVTDVTKSLKTVAAALQEAVMEDGTRKHVLGRIVKNIEVLTQDLSEMTSANKGKVNDIIDQVRDVTSTLDELINDDSDSGFKKTWKNSMVRIDHTLKNLDEVTTKVAKGEGTIGKLINDESTVDELNKTIEGINSMLGSADRLQLGVDFHADYLQSVSKTKSTIGIRIQPGLDRFYELGLIDDPAGVVTKERSVYNYNGGPDSTENTTKTYFNKTKFTAVFGKNFWDWSIKGGMIENAGGIGVAYHVIPKRLKFEVEAFDFSKTNLRASARLDLVYGLYLLGGINDSLDKNDARSGYLGAGLFLTNDDLKLLLAKAPL